MQQGRLARARGSDDGHHLPLIEGKVDVAQHRQDPCPVGELLRHVHDTNELRASLRPRVLTHLGEQPRYPKIGQNPLSMRRQGRSHGQPTVSHASPWRSASTGRRREATRAGYELENRTMTIAASPTSTTSAGFTNTGSFSM